MAYSLTWLAQVLKAAGLKVAEQPGWENRGRGPMGTVRGVICHHTAGPKAGIMPSLKVITQGRSDLPGPLCQLGLGRDGTWFVVAAGRANHAGGGSWKGITTGNSSFIGIEAENMGTAADPWPAVQMDSYKRGVAAILKKLGADESMCAGHKEYALPKGRKSDPSFDMNDFRKGVAAILGGRAPIPPPIAAKDSSDRPTLRRGAAGDLVKIIQAMVGVADDGAFGGKTEAAVRAFQSDRGLVPDGIVGPGTWKAIDGG
jgi:N-acetylmuramoyl-L-alanine amidase/Putative peptidoglycan binding domain